MSGACDTSNSKSYARYAKHCKVCEAVCRRRYLDDLDERIVKCIINYTVNSNEAIDRSREAYWDPLV